MDCVTKPNGRSEMIVIGHVQKPLRTCKGTCLGMKECKAASYQYRFGICQLFFDETQVSINCNLYENIGICLHCSLSNFCL